MTPTIFYPITRWIFNSQYRSTGLTKYNIEFWAVKPDGTDKRKIVTLEGNNSNNVRYQWSPDGGKIAYDCNTMDINRNTLVKLGLFSVSGGDNEDLLTQFVSYFDYLDKSSFTWIDDEHIIWRYKDKVRSINITTHENQEIDLVIYGGTSFRPDKSSVRFC